MSIFLTLVVICCCTKVHVILFTYFKKTFLWFILLVLPEFLENVIMKLGKGL